MKWLLLLLSFNLYAQWDPREQVTVTPADPVADTNIVKNLTVNDVQFYLPGLLGYSLEDKRVVEITGLESNFPSSVNTFIDYIIPTPWTLYEVPTPFYFLDAGTPTVAITVPVNQLNYPVTYGWTTNDELRLRVVFTNPQSQSTISPEAIEDGLIEILNPTFNPNNGDPEFTQVNMTVRVRNPANASTFWVDTLAPYTDFYGVNMTGFLDYPANTQPNPRTLYVEQWKVDNFKIAETKELVLLLLNVVKNNIGRIEALEAFHP